MRFVDGLQKRRERGCRQRQGKGPQEALDPVKAVFVLSIMEASEGF